MIGAEGESRGNKAFLELRGRSVLEHSLAAFRRARCVAELVLVLRPEDEERARDLLGDVSAPEVRCVHGGEERTDSVRAGCDALSSRAEVVLVHDVARPLVLAERIDAVAAAAREHGAALLAVPVIDTIKGSDEPGWASETLDRSRLWAAHTPQAFRREVLAEVLERAARDDFRPTDDAALHERYRGPVRLVEDDPSNLKLTTPADLLRAEAWLDARGEVSR
jgi:2-C-methyl-D-erythritol 4-phosphate cytidylyltransferase